MTWILLCFERFAHVRDTEGDHAMRHQNSVFHSLTKHVPWDRLERSVEKHGADSVAQTEHQAAFYRLAVWPTQRRIEPARDRDRHGEPRDAALSRGRGPGEALDACGCQCGAT